MTLLKQAMFFAVLITLNSILVFAQTATELAEKHINAIGGTKNVHAINTIKTSGNVTAGPGMEFPFTMYQKRPQFMYLESSAMGMTLKQGFDGKTAWSINPFSGSDEVQVASPDESKGTREQADLDDIIMDYEKKGKKIDYLGEEELEGTSYYKLKVSHNEDINYVYLNKENYLIYKITTKTFFQEKEVLSETILSNYKKVSEILMPHTIETKMDGNVVSSVNILNTEVNLKLDDEMFKVPGSASTNVDKADKEIKDSKKSKKEKKAKKSKKSKK